MAANSGPGEVGVRSGIIRCGSKWKAYFQSQGVQFYLGLFETEAEAIHAYDYKMDHLRSLGSSTLSAQAAEVEISLDEDGDGYTEPESCTNQDKSDYNMGKGRLMWERLCCIYQRLLLAKATRGKLSESQLVNPDYHKDAMVKSLNEEIVILSVAKSQLEQAVCNYFAKELMLNSDEEGDVKNELFSAAPLAVVDDSAAIQASSPLFVSLDGDELVEEKEVVEPIAKRQKKGAR